jgi:hypothetical protein
MRKPYSERIHFAAPGRAIVITMRKAEPLRLRLFGENWFVTRRVALREEAQAAEVDLDVRRLGAAVRLQRASGCYFHDSHK